MQAAAGETAAQTETASAESTDAEAMAGTEAVAGTEAAAGTETAAGTEISAGAVTFTDDLGREVTVENPKRVATLIGSFADIWMSAGGEVVATANDSWTSLDLPLAEDTVNLGSILEPSVEALIAAEPDFVIASANTEGNVNLEGVLTDAGINVAYFAVSDFQEYLHMLDVCTDITGRKDLYEKNGLDVEAQIEEIKKRADGSAPEVLFLRASSSSVKAKGSEGNVCGEMLANLGCVNIADSDNSLLDSLSMEAIVAADPDYIFITTQGSDLEAAQQSIEESLLSNPAWKNLTAVKEGRYYPLEKRLFNLKPNARWAEAYEILADILYPAE